MRVVHIRCRAFSPPVFLAARADERASAADDALGNWAALSEVAAATVSPTPAGLFVRSSADGEWPEGASECQPCRINAEISVIAFKDVLSVMAFTGSETCPCAEEQRVNLCRGAFRSSSVGCQRHCLHRYGS